MDFTNAMLLKWFLAWTMAAIQSASSTSSIFFNKTSVVHLPIVLRVQNGRTVVSFSFRTCSHGELLHQRGLNGDSFTLATHSGAIQARWNASNNPHNITVGESLDDNQVYIVKIFSYLGNLTLTIRRLMDVKYSVILANSRVQPELLNLDLSGGTTLRVGAGFTGCMYRGVNFSFNNSASSVNATFDHCPLDTQNGCPPNHRDCSTNPCVHGNCQPQPNQSPGFTCKCNDGFTGTLCNVNIDDCTGHACRNGVCRDGVNNYTCDCGNSGYSGQFCDMDVDECQLTPPICGNGTCLNIPSSYECECPVGYTGARCQNDIDECLSNPCQNGGRCDNRGGTYFCQCTHGYTGTHCTQDVDDCLTAQCPQQNTECRDKLGGYDCVCKPGYANVSDVCEDIDECLSASCNNGTCVNLENDFSCNCSPGFSGRLCQDDIDDCVPDACQNGATCVDSVNNYTCTCAPGYTDRNCSTNIDDCEPNPCVNAVTCTDLVNGFTCNCSHGWTGDTCADDINECDASPGPCRNGAKCVNDRPGFHCDCARGFNGSSCDHNIDDCRNNRCENGAACIDGVNSYTCRCSSDWMGHFCNQSYDACAFQPCINGTCSLVGAPPSHDYTCACASGFTGVNCSVNVDDCVNVTCAGGKECVDGINSFECKCPEGYTGPNCTEDINECELNKNICNSFPCNNTVGGYECACPYTILNLTKYHKRPWVHETGFKGKNCEIDIDECSYSPPICMDGICNNTGVKGYSCACISRNGINVGGIHCQIRKDNCEFNEIPADDNPVCHNNGTCIPQLQGYRCQCQAGYTGPRCKTDIDECQKYRDDHRNEEPCLYNGSCVDRVNRFTCDCVQGLMGDRCEVNIDDCTPNPCGPGTCTDYINRFECNCTDTGFKGDNCSINIDDCIGNECHHNSTCNDGIKEYNCSCHPGFSGELCKVDFPDCDTAPCGDHGTCYERSRPENYPTHIAGVFSYTSAQGYVCVCDRGYNGSNCENDVDECLLYSQPCQNGGVCHDARAHYVCKCPAGYRGKNCEIDIDECLVYHPCQNGGRCHDRLAGYDCECSDIFADRRYSGLNCTERLTGCDGKPCRNSATCLPVTREPGFTCNCQPGFGGDLCENPTTVSLNGLASVSFAVPGIIRNVSFSFKTRQKDTVLFLVGSGTFVFVEVVDSTLCLLTYNQNGNQREARCMRKGIVDESWHSVRLNHHEDVVTLTLDEDKCARSNLNDCSLSWNAGFSAYSPVTLGGISPSAIGAQTTRSRRSFIGCLQSVTINGDLKLPANITQLDTNVGIGCEPTNQCTADTCTRHGQCTDFWFNFECQCDRPYLLPDCSESVPSATFGRTSNQSSLTYNTSKINTTHRFDLSLFIQTRSANGVILYSGNQRTSVIRSFVTLETINGRVCSRMKLCREVILFCSAVRYDDGEQYFTRLLLTTSRLSLSIKGWTISKDIESIRRCDLSKDIFIIGGLPPSPSISRREALSFDEIFGDKTFYTGALQDIKLNKNDVPVSMNQSGSDIQLVQSSEVLVNAPTEDVCSRNDQCSHGKCKNVPYNTFKCDCDPGYAGTLCNHTDWCQRNSCPSDAQCQSLKDRIECVAAATLKRNLALRYTFHSLDSSILLDDVTVEVRTRKNSGTIIYIDDPDKFFLTLRLYDGKILIEYNFEGLSSRLFVSKVKINDGKFHKILLRQLPDRFKLTVDKRDEFFRFKSLPLLSDINSVTRNSHHIYVGAPVNLVSSYNAFFGCLRELRIGGILLPFHRPGSGATNTFSCLNPDAIQRGCHGNDACDQNPCRNGATCIDKWNDYRCECAKGYQGRDCEINIDDCQPMSCSGQGRCIDGINSYTCACYAAYTGDKCQAGVDFCQQAGLPCQNNAECISGPYNYECKCTLGFVGRHCAIPVNSSCSERTCVYGETCENITGSDLIPTELAYNCTCSPGYIGAACDIEEDFCRACNANNTDTCRVTDPSSSTYNCSCKRGYNGSNCEERIDECFSSPCLNGGNCSTSQTSYKCTCPPGWTGQNCERDVDECDEMHMGRSCLRGVCQNTDGAYICNCTGTGFTGVNCDVDVNECDAGVCKNDANCSNTDGAFNCSCTRGYAGYTCSEPSCDEVTCEHGGRCQHNESVWWCDCPTYYEGQTCEIAGRCVTYPCGNGTCYQNLTADTYRCVCNSGWRGDDCKEDIPECTELEPCQNNATCEEQNGSYKCHCASGYSGENCSVNVDDCAMATCAHETPCIDLLNTYVCDCSGKGYKGQNCDVDIDECKEGDPPCRNGTTCENLIGSFRCYCSTEWDGTVCGEVKAPDNSVVIAVSVVVVVVVIVIIVIIVIFVLKSRKSRSKSGKYSPSTQELSGARVELGHVIKKDPVEKLI